MINGSQAFNEAVNEGGYPYKARLSHEGTVIDCDISSCKVYKGSTGNDAFSIGSIYIPYIEVEAVELTTPIFGKEMKLEVGVMITDEQTEWIKLGYFTVSKTSGSVANTKFTAVGRIAAVLPKIQVSVSASMTPAQLIQATQTAVRAAGYSEFTIDTTGVTLSTSPITNLSNTNAQRIIEILAGVVGAYATEDNNGNVVLFRYDTTNYIEYDGSRMTQYPVTHEEDFELLNVKVIKTEEYEQDDGTIVPEVSFISGEPYEWVVMNSDMTAELFPAYCQNCLGLSYRPATINFAYGDPRLEAKDILQITDVDDTVYLVPCMTLVHDIAGGITTEVIAPHEGEGEIDSESEMGGKGPITQQIDAMGRHLMTAQVSAAQAKRSAAQAKADAVEAKANAASARADATSARADAASARADATTARQEALSATSSANTALMGLSQVESVIDALNWIAAHGTYTKATTYIEGTTYYTLAGTAEPSPYAERKYYVLSEGVYVQTDVQATAVAEPVVGDIDTYYELLEGRYILTEDTEIDPNKTYYTISDTYYVTTGTPVPIPKPEDIGLYYTLNVTDAIGDYIQTHLAVTNDGLYVMADDSEWKVLIAEDGVYIINPDGENVAKYKDMITIGKDDGTEGAQFIDYHSLRLYDAENMAKLAEGLPGKPYFYVSDLRPKSGHIIYDEITGQSNYSSDWGVYYALSLPSDADIKSFSAEEDRIDVSYTLNGVTYELNNKDFEFYRQCQPWEDYLSGTLTYTAGLKITFYGTYLTKDDVYTIKYYTDEEEDYEFTKEYEQTFVVPNTSTSYIKMTHPTTIPNGHIQLKSIARNGVLLFGLRRSSSGVYFQPLENIYYGYDDHRLHYSSAVATVDLCSSKLKALTFGNRRSGITLGKYSVAIGDDTRVIGDNSVGIGDKAYVSGNNSLALGNNANCSYDNRIEIRNTDVLADPPSLYLYNNVLEEQSEIYLRRSGYSYSARRIDNITNILESYRTEQLQNVGSSAYFRMSISNYFRTWNGYRGHQACLLVTKDRTADDNTYFWGGLSWFLGVDNNYDNPTTFIDLRQAHASSTAHDGTRLAYLRNGDLKLFGSIDATTYSYTYSNFRYASGFTYYSTSGTSAPKAVKFGKIVTLGGAIKPTSAQSSTGQKVMGYVPANCKPAQDVMFLQQGSGVARYQLFIRASDGALIADRYGTTSDIAIPNGVWLNISATYVCANASQ